MLDLTRIRQDFPILQKEINGKRIIYLDSSCMSLKPKQVIERMNEYYLEFPGCAGRSVHRISTDVALAVDDARSQLQELLRCRNQNELIFTRNTTESINIVAQGYSLNPGDRVVITDHEHNSNLVPWINLQKRKGIKLDIVPSNPDNTFNLETFENIIGPEVKIVSMVHTTNLDGHTNPAEEIIKIAHDFNALVMLDGAQSAPHKPIDLIKMDVDFFALSIHKMCGPSGVGILYGKQHLLEELEPLITGGGAVKNTTYDTSEPLAAPEKFEAGLQDYAGMIGAGVAAKYILEVGLEEIEKHDIKLNKLMTDRLANLEEISIIGPKDPDLRGSTFSFNIKGIDCHDVAMILDEGDNIMIRSGMHCVHSWFNKNNINGSARAAVYLYNTEEEVEKFSDKVLDIIKNFK